MCHDWPVKNVFVDLPIKMKGNSKIHITGGPLKKVRWGGDFTSCVNIFLFTFPSFLKLNLACMNNFFFDFTLLQTLFLCEINRNPCMESVTS